MSNETIFYLTCLSVTFVAAFVLLVRDFRVLSFWHNVVLSVLCFLCVLSFGAHLSTPSIGQVRDNCVYYEGEKCMRSFKEIYAPTERGPMWLEVK